jgi:hypothetical protein
MRIQHKRIWVGGLLAVSMVSMVLASSRPGDIPQTYTDLTFYSHRLYEDVFSRTQVSDDAKWALRTTGGRQTLYSMASGSPADDVLNGGVEGLQEATLCGGGLLRRVTRGKNSVWVASEIAGRSDRPAVSDLLQVREDIPASATPVCSDDGRQIAYYDAVAGKPAQTEISVRGRTKQSRFVLKSRVTNAVFSHDGTVLYVLGMENDGTSTLYSVSPSTRRVFEVARRLDANTLREGALAVMPGNDAVVLSLAGELGVTAIERQDAHKERWLKLYRLDLHSHVLNLIAGLDGEDEINPAIAGDSLFWVSSRVTQSVGIVPLGGGSFQPVSEDAAILPSWSPEGRRLAFVIAKYRLADLPLNLDVGIVDVDDADHPSSPPRMFVVGNHEDFFPLWSPDGRWIAWHSHRAASALPYPMAAGATDDIWLRKAEDLAAPEIRLTQNAQEAGWISWSPDGRHLVYTTWDRAGKPDIYRLHILQIDPLSGHAMSDEAVTLPEEIHSPYAADWSPDGRRIALEDEYSPQEQAIWLVRPDGSGARRIVTFASDTVGGLCWLPDGTGLVFAALENGRMQIFVTSVTGGGRYRVTDGVNNYITPRVSPDGRRVAVARIDTVQTLQHRKL